MDAQIHFGRGPGRGSADWFESSAAGGGGGAAAFVDALTIYRLLKPYVSPATSNFHLPPTTYLIPDSNLPPTTNNLTSITYRLSTITCRLLPSNNDLATEIKCLVSHQVSIHT